MRNNQSGTKLQNLRNFTVQICRLDDDAILGTGVIVSVDGKIVTCGHVLNSISKSLIEDNGEIGIYFAQSNTDIKEGKAKLFSQFPTYEDDVVLLKLIDDYFQLTQENVAVLGSAESSGGHPFKSYGFRTLGPYSGALATGTIIGEIDPPRGKILLADPVQLDSPHINDGMSGSAVLDTDDNLVVGIISQTWYPDSSTKDRNTAWAVNSKVLTFEPFELSIRNESYPLAVPPSFVYDKEVVENYSLPKNINYLNDAPNIVNEWVDRDELTNITFEKWDDTNCNVVEFIGLGGEGKSLLVRSWIEKLLTNPSEAQPDGIFWWSFYNRPDVEDFLEEALSYLYRGEIEPSLNLSSTSKVHHLMLRLLEGKYIFVLDGIEILQSQSRGNYGTLNNIHIKYFIESILQPDNKSFCLITSRIPIFDFMEYINYSHMDVNGLAIKEGCTLLKNMGIHGENEQFSSIVSEWEGHALTLSIIGSYLLEAHEGCISHIDKLPKPSDNASVYDSLYRILNRYNEYFTEHEKSFLMVFSVFRLPIEESGFDLIFRSNKGEKSIIQPICELNSTDFNNLVEKLLASRFVIYNPTIKQYTTHPLIRSFYYDCLVETGNAYEIHNVAKKYYEALSEKTNKISTLENLKPFVENVYHTCKSNNYDAAAFFLHENLNINPGGQKESLIGWLGSRFGAWESVLKILTEFFPDNDVYKEPLIKEDYLNFWIMAEIGFCYTSVGNPQKSIDFLERGLDIITNMIDENAGSAPAEFLSNALYDLNTVYANLTASLVHLGELDYALKVAQKGYSSTKNAYRQIIMKSWVAWIYFLKGNLKSAKKNFDYIKNIDRRLDHRLETQYENNRRDNNQSQMHIIEETRKEVEGFTSQRGAHYAIYLLKIGDYKLAREIAEKSLERSESNNWTEEISMFHRILGDLELNSKNFEKAFSHYTKALRIARCVQRKDILIEILISKGRYAIVQEEFEDSLSYLSEALKHSIEGQYKIYQCDIHVVMSLAYLSLGKEEKSKYEAAIAQKMCSKIGYHLKAL